MAKDKDGDETMTTEATSSTAVKTPSKKKETLAKKKSSTTKKAPKAKTKSPTSTNKKPSTATKGSSTPKSSPKKQTLADRTHSPIRSSPRKQKKPVDKEVEEPKEKVEVRSTTDKISTDTPRKKKKKRKGGEKKKENSTPPPPPAVAVAVASPAPKEEAAADTTTSNQGRTFDVEVHRVRHMDFKPSSVLSMASSSSNNDGDGNFVLGREDGSYELYEVSAIADSDRKTQTRIFPLATIAGSPQIGVAHSLCFVNGNTPVAGGPDGTIWVANFKNSQLQSRISCGGGGVFDLVTCSGGSGLHKTLPLVATACQDGSVRIYQVDDDRIDPTPIGTIPTAGSAVLSLAWQQQVTGNTIGSDEVQTILFAGVADGTIRKYDLSLTSIGDSSWKLNKVTSVMRMTVESRGRKTSTKIWTMQIVNDNAKDRTLVTGNSLGQVQFWNTQTGTLQQSFTQTEYKADVLQISVSADQNKVFATGVDSRVICLERPTSAGFVDPNDERVWKWTTAQRPHTHDVKAMTIVNVPLTTTNGDANSKSASKDYYRETIQELLITAGMDTKICSYMVSEFKARRPIISLPWPAINCPISVAGLQRITAMQRHDSVDFYQLDRTDGNHKPVAKDSSTAIGTIQIQTVTNLVTSSLSNCGKFLAVCNATSVFLFRLKASGGEIKPTKIDLPKSIEKLSITAIRFHRNELLFLADNQNQIHVFHLKSGEESCIVKVGGDDNSSLSLPIDSLQVSKNGNLLMAMLRTKKDCIHVFKRSNTGGGGGGSGGASKSAVYEPYWTIPGLAGLRPATTTLIHGEDEASNNVQLAVATSNAHLYIFDLAKQKLSPWSEANEFPINDANWPTELNQRRDFPIRLSSNPKNPKQLIMVRPFL